MDYKADYEARIRYLERQVARLVERDSQHFSRYAPQVGHHRIVRLAKTCTDAGDTPTYPVNGATVFPAIFQSGGFTDAAGSQTGQYTAQDSTRQVRVFSVLGHFIPVNTVIKVWQDIGSDASYPGMWWTDYTPGTMIGKPDSAISANTSGTISIYTGSSRTDSTLNVTAYTIVALSSGKWVTVEDVEGYYYAFKWEC